MATETSKDESALTHVLLIRLQDKFKSSEEVSAASPLEKPEALLSYAKWVCNELSPSLLGPMDLDIQRVVLRQESDVLEAYIYLKLGVPCSVSDDQFLSLQNRLNTSYRSYFLTDAHAFTEQKTVIATSMNLSLSRLSMVSDLLGHSAHIEPQLHYVVETDVEKGWDDEITQWYSVEHLPGLASVPGCASARRYVNLDDGPRSLACYDLHSEAVLTSPQWLAIRATPWSSKARPHFINTKRSLYPRILA